MCDYTDQSHEADGIKTPKVSSVDGLEIGLQQLIEQQRSGETLKRYWQLADKPSVEGKPQFVKTLSLQYHISAQSAGQYLGLLTHGHITVSVIESRRRAGL